MAARVIPPYVYTPPTVYANRTPKAPTAPSASDAAVTAELLARRRAGVGVTHSSGYVPPNGADPTIDPNLGFTHPAYQGTDPAYAAWLAQADLQSNNAISDAKLRRAQAQQAYQQALEDLSTQSVGGRRNIQTNMLQRGLFQSGEFGRRQGEFDSQIDQGRQRALGAETDQIGSIDQAQKAAIANLGMQGVQQMSQAMMRDQVAAYNAQQAAIAAGTPAPSSAAPASVAAVPAAAPPPPLAATSFGTPVAKKPAVKKASGSTGALVQKKTGLQ